MRILAGMKWGNSYTLIFLHCTQENLLLSFPHRLIHISHYNFSVVLTLSQMFPHTTFIGQERMSARCNCPSAVQSAVYRWQIGNIQL